MKKTVGRRKPKKESCSSSRSSSPEEIMPKKKTRRSGANSVSSRSRSKSPQAEVKTRRSSRRTSGSQKSSEELQDQNVSVSAVGKDEKGPLDKVVEAVHKDKVSDVEEAANATSDIDKEEASKLHQKEISVSEVKENSVGSEMNKKDEDITNKLENANTSNNFSPIKRKRSTSPNRERSNSPCSSKGSNSPEVKKSRASRSRSGSRSSSSGSTTGNLSKRSTDKVSVNFY